MDRSKVKIKNSAFEGVPVWVSWFSWVRKVYFGFKTMWKKLQKVATRGCDLPCVSILTILWTSMQCGKSCESVSLLNVAGILDCICNCQLKTGLCGENCVWQNGVDPNKIDFPTKQGNFQISPNMCSGEMWYFSTLAKSFLHWVRKCKKNLPSPSFFPFGSLWFSFWKFMIFFASFPISHVW